MAPNVLKSYGQDIKCILHTAPDKSYYLKGLSKKNMTRDSFIYLDSRKKLGTEVDYGKLSVVADVAMIHEFHDVGIFQPTYEEVLNQIPDEYIEDVCAFEIMYGPSDDSDLEIFGDLVCMGYHAFVVRLYKELCEGEEQAPVPFNYPKGADVPEGMDASDFRFIQNTVEQQWIY